MRASPFLVSPVVVYLKIPERGSCYTNQKWHAACSRCSRSICETACAIWVSCGSDCRSHYCLQQALKDPLFLQNPSAHMALFADHGVVLREILAMVSRYSKSKVPVSLLNDPAQHVQLRRAMPAGSHGTITVRTSLLHCSSASSVWLIASASSGTTRVTIRDVSSTLRRAISTSTGSSCSR